MWGGKNGGGSRLDTLNGEKIFKLKNVFPIEEPRRRTINE